MNWLDELADKIADKWNEYFKDRSYKFDRSDILEMAVIAHEVFDNDIEAMKK